MKDIWFPPDPQESAEFQSLQSWYRQTKFEQLAAKGSELLAEARANWQDSDRTRELLDAKAERIFLWASAIGALVFSAGPRFTVVPASLIPAAILLVISMLFAIRAWSPGMRAAPPPIRELFDVAERRPESFAAILAGSLALAATGNRIIGRWKARQLRYAVNLLAWGIISLGIGFAVSILHG